MRMASPPLTLGFQRGQERSFERFEILAGGLIGALLLTLIAFLLAQTVLREIGPSPQAIEAVRQTLRPDIRDQLQPKPLERWLFIDLTLLSPFCVLAGCRIARSLLRRFAGPSKTERRFLVDGVMLLAGGLGIYLLHGPTLFCSFVFPSSPVIDLAIIFGAGALLFFGGYRIPQPLPGYNRPGMRNRGFTSPAGFGQSLRDSFPFPLGGKRLWSLLVVVLAFGVALLPRGLSERSILSTKEISPFGWEIHFQAVAYSLTQIYAGKPLLTAAPPLYGYNAEILLPVFKLTGLSVFKFCVVMGIIQAVALAALLLIAVRYLRTPAVTLLCCAALVFFLGSTCLVGRRPFDPVFQYWPIRFIFPALSVSVYLWAARRATRGAWLVLGVFGGLALMWNLDSGIAAAGASLVGLGLEAIGTIRNRRISPEGKRAAWLAPVVTFGAMLATAALFWLFLQMQAGWKTPFHRTSDYQRLFYGAGYSMLPMPFAPHPWWLVVAAYLFGMGFAIRRFLGGNCNALSRLTLFLSIIGIGLFSYYQGRSVDFNLMNASWPAILLGAIFADRLVRGIRARLMPAGACWVALPIAYLGLMALVMLPGAFASLWSFGFSQWRAAIVPPASARPDSIQHRVEFIRAHMGNDSDCAILADYQAVYFMETGFRSSLDAPGLTEIFFMQDLEKLRSALMANPPRHLFADASTLKILELKDVIRDRFRIVSTFGNGKLWYMEPRALLRQ